MSEIILIVEDEERLAELHHDYLEQAGYGSKILGEGTGVVEWVKENRPALILLDLMLPGKDGITICREIREFSRVPIIMVTARVEEIDRLLGLEYGADDYICKPFSPREVVARVKAVLRRTQSSPQDEENKMVRFEIEKHLVILRGKPLELTAVEFQLLKILADSPGRIFSRDQLMEHIYTDQRIVCDRTIDSHVKKLRKKIAAVDPGIELIRSVYGVGYKFEVTT
jgi:two-component system response regulator BaeR